MGKKIVPIREVFVLTDEKLDFNKFLDEANSSNELVHVGRGYKRSAGNDKVTLLVPVAKNMFSDILYEQLLRYEMLYAIDTNTKEIGDIRLCVTCVAHIAMQYLGDNKWKLTLTKLPAMLSIDLDSKPEVVAWLRLIESFPLQSYGRIGIVVDSELGKIPLFNKKTIPIKGDSFLPANVELIYASTDADSFSPLNKAIKTCNTDANLIMNVLSGKSDVFDAAVKKIRKSSGGYFLLHPKIVQEV